MDQLFNIMRKELGSKDAAHSEFLKYKLASLDVLEMTASELFQEAGKDGWDHLLLNLTVEEFGKLLDKSAPKRWAAAQESIAARTPSKSRSVSIRKKTQKKSKTRTILSSTGQNSSRKRKVDARVPGTTAQHEKNNDPESETGTQNAPVQLELLSLAPPAQPEAPRRRQVAIRPSVDDQIIDFLRDNPWCHKREIASGAHLDEKKLQQRLKHLIQIGWIKTVEEDGKIRFALN